jgi:DNA invertase Pin-like site-specific DNA recombinase
VSRGEVYRLGRPKIDRVTERKVRRLLAKGVGILKVAKSLGIGTGTVQRISGERAMSLRGAEFLDSTGQIFPRFRQHFSPS